MTVEFRQAHLFPLSDFELASLHIQFQHVAEEHLRAQKRILRAGGMHPDLLLFLKPEDRPSIELLASSTNVEPLCSNPISCSS